ncbi:MAG: hypothetical protein LBT45_01870 [Rickettsiales bacterium]|jgi:hypothetical protein|nr:hypothetical protein [Rickettsiales bacterium]
MNFVARAEHVLSFGQSGRDVYAYEQLLAKLMTGYRLKHKDFEELASMGWDGVKLLNDILTEYRTKVQYA